MDAEVENGQLLPVTADSTPGCRNMTDGKVVDFVLPYMVTDEENTKIRNRFLDNLKDLQDDNGEKTGKGLILETVVEGEVQNEYGLNQMEAEDDSTIHYVKVHAPIDVLYDLAEDVQMKMPTEINDIEIKEWNEKENVKIVLSKIDIFQLRNPQIRQQTEYFVQTFQKDRLSKFVNHDDPENFFSPAERGRLVHTLLSETSYGNKDKKDEEEGDEDEEEGDEDEDIGIDNLIENLIFLDAYPLHDGPTLTSDKVEDLNMRQQLQTDWASWSRLFKYQPIEGIREYFGEKLALYFAWLGFYTMCLIPAAIVGILCFFYGIAYAQDSEIVKETCSDPLGDNGTTHKFLMCPSCDKYCSYFLLNTACADAKTSKYFDNNATVFFAIFMSLWSTFFLEFWKRRQFSYAHKWHSMGFEEGEERVRPEYRASTLITFKQNPVTKKQEPHMPKGAKGRRFVGSVSVVLFFVLLIVVALVGIIVFRVSCNAALQGSANKNVQAKSSMIISILAGLINLVVINVLKLVYNKVAVLLTDWEIPRTRTDYEDSFTIKMFLFQFVNTYSSIFYLAFFQSEGVTGYPGNYRRMGKDSARFPGCGARGCFLGLAIQLVIIMVGQQIIGNVQEALIPTAKKWWNDRKNKKQREADGSPDVAQSQWVDDYEGAMQTKFTLFWEYLEIVLQYGFVTMFVAGFPLAPFFALLNNIIEIRVDACNYVINNRRPVARRAEDIGAWLGILNSLTLISVIINAFVIAFTSTFIDRTVYRYRFGHGSTKGYVDWSMAYFNVSVFSNEVKPLNATLNGIPEQPYCRFPGHHQPAPPYDRNIDYWLLLGCRLAFILAFVMGVLFITWFVGYIVPDIPKTVNLRIKREKYLASKADKDRRRGIRPTSSTETSGNTKTATSML